MAADLTAHDVLNIADLRRLAAQRLPRVVFDYIDGGAEDEVTLRGSTRLFWPRGEVVAARAADSAGTAYTLSTLAGSGIEEVREASRGPLWYQLYLAGGRDVPRP